MGDYPRYTRIKDLMASALQRKTSWGRNEIAELLSSVLCEVADEEITFYQSQIDEYIESQDPDLDGEDAEWNPEDIDLRRDYDD